ncbi:MAG: hypothetical protein ACXWUX_15200 [Allosphingosinicella sp.]
MIGSSVEHSQNNFYEGSSGAAAGPPPPFDPVPTRVRRDGWTPERQRAFIAALAETLCVDRAACAVGLSRESAYRLCRLPGAASFAAAWSAALAPRRRGVTGASLLWHRAFYGTLRPIVRGGEVVGAVQRPDNRAAMTLLNRLDQSDRASARMRARHAAARSSR